MANIAAEAREMFGVRGKMGDSGVDHPAGGLHQFGQARRPTGVAWDFEREPQPLFDQLPELAPAQCRLRLRLAVDL